MGCAGILPNSFALLVDSGEATVLVFMYNLVALSTAFCAFQTSVSFSTSSLTQSIPIEMD